LPEIRGANAVANTFSGRARTAQPALIDGSVGAVWAPGGEPRAAFFFTITDGKITSIEVVAEPERLREFDLTILTG
jgi:RNA polymerase sigma-70 factor (ECF subfamily)